MLQNANAPLFVRVDAGAKLLQAVEHGHVGIDRRKPRRQQALNRRPFVGEYLVGEVLRFSSSMRCLNDS